ncbi:hypothetical protein C8R44DRAFT_786889 [Mycena epipterygia]|nr:hypothetical protein C8R44DRAFT_786889 [Mycena epipterygia]
MHAVLVLAKNAAAGSISGVIAKIGGAVSNCARRGRRGRSAEITRERRNSTKKANEEESRVTSAGSPRLDKTATLRS